MASRRDFVDHVVDQMSGGALPIDARAMFGEYGVYAGGKLVALVCDDRLFVKPTAGGRAFIGDVVEAPPYPGAKPCFLIEDGLDDARWLGELVRITAEELPDRKGRKGSGSRPAGPADAAEVT